MGDDEAAQHEEKIDEQIGIAHEADGIEVMVERKVMKRDEEGAHTAPSVEDVKTMPVWLGHPAPGAVEMLGSARPNPDGAAALRKSAGASGKPRCWYGTETGLHRQGCRVTRLFAPT